MRMLKIEILIGPHILSCQNDFSWILLIFLSQLIWDYNNCEYKEWPFSFGYFVNVYVNSKSDYILRTFPELVMSTDFLSFEHPSVLLFSFCWVYV